MNTVFQKLARRHQTLGQVFVLEPGETGGQGVQVRGIEGGRLVCEIVDLAVVVRHSGEVVVGPARDGWPWSDPRYVAALLGSRLLGQYLAWTWAGDCTGGDAHVVSVDHVAAMPCPAPTRDLYSQLCILYKQAVSEPARRPTALDSAMERVIVEIFDLDVDDLMALELAAMASK